MTKTSQLVRELWHVDVLPVGQAFLYTQFWFMYNNAILVMCNDLFLLSGYQPVVAGSDGGLCPWSR